MDLEVGVEVALGLQLASELMLSHLVRPSYTRSRDLVWLVIHLLIKITVVDNTL